MTTSGLNRSEQRFKINNDKLMCHSNRPPHSWPTIGPNKKVRTTQTNNKDNNNSIRVFNTVTVDSRNKASLHGSGARWRLSVCPSGSPLSASSAVLNYSNRFALSHALSKSSSPGLGGASCCHAAAVLLSIHSMLCIHEGSKCQHEMFQMDWNACSLSVDRPIGSN